MTVNSECCLVMVHHTLIVSSQVMSTISESILQNQRKWKSNRHHLFSENILKSTRLNELTDIHVFLWVSCLHYGDPSTFYQVKFVFFFSFLFSLGYSNS